MSEASSSTLATETLLPNSPRSPIPGSFIESPTSPFPEELDISNRENLSFSEPEYNEETKVTADLFGSNYRTAPGTPYSGHAFGGYHIESTLFTDYRQEESVESSNELIPDTTTTINFDFKDESFKQSIPFNPPAEASTSYFPIFPILPPVNLNQQPAPIAQLPVQPPVQPVAMAAASMPFRKEKSALNIIDKISPGCKLTCYISDIEGLFTHCKASKLSGKRKSHLRLQDLLYTQGGLPPALKGSNRIRSVCRYDRKK